MQMSRSGPELKLRAPSLEDGGSEAEPHFQLGHNERPGPERV